MLESLSPQLVICVRVDAPLQDHLLPYMADCRHTPDTLFFVAEEDFRLTRGHAALTPEQIAGQLAPQPAGLQQMPGEATISLDELYELRTSLAPLQGEVAAGATCESAFPDAEVSAMLGFYRRRRKPTAAEMQTVSQELEDLVRICTCAHRQRAGGLVWLSWCGGAGGKTRKSAPCHGSTLIAMTSWFARQLLQNFDKLEFMHFDIALRNVLQKPPADWDWCQASFVHPSIGHYCEHVSGCQEGLGWRSSEWDATWCQGGTRKDPADASHVHRTLHKFSEKGVPPLLGAVVLPELPFEDEDLRWFTLRTDLESLSPQRSREPGVAAAAGAAAASSAGSAQLPPSAGSGQRPGLGGKRSRTQLSLKEEDPTRHETNEPGQQLLTGRAKRQHRQHATNYRFRLFTDNEAQAASAASPQDCAPPSASAAALQCECMCACCVQSDVRTALWGLAVARSTFALGLARESLSPPSDSTRSGPTGPVCLSVPCTLPSGGGRRLRAAPVPWRPAAPGLGAPVDARGAAAEGPRRRGALCAPCCGQNGQRWRRARGALRRLNQRHEKGAELCTRGAVALSRRLCRAVVTRDCRVPACVMMCDAGVRARRGARGGEPFAPSFPLHLRPALQCTRAESGATGEAGLCVQCAWLSSGTPQSPCVDQGHAGSPSFHARLAAQSLSPCNQVLHCHQACLHSLRVHSLHCGVLAVGAHP